MSSFTSKKLLLLIFLLAISVFANAEKKTGCLLGGNTVYPNSKNTNNTTGNIFYYNTGSFARRTHAGDSNCGVLGENLKFVNPYRACDVEGVGNYGGVVEYEETINNCPIDDYVPIMFLAITGLSAIIIKKKSIPISC